ncbi:MAG: glycosyltransferase family 4 protein [Proteobacteria bacterium]|nr:glycosyltransferase family 4 protein [Pseudomonadota bacterium]
MSGRRIAMVHPEMRIAGGAERVVLDFTEALQAAGHEVVIVTWHWAPAAFEGRLDRHAPRLVPAPRSRLGGADPRTLAALEGALADCTLVLAHNHPANAYVGLARVAARRLWYCEEPHRRLHARETSPGLVAALEAGRVDLDVPGHRELVAVLRRSRWKRRLSPHHRARRALDFAGVRGLDGVIANSRATAAQVRVLYGREAPVFFPQVEIPPALPPPAPAGGARRVLVMGGFGAAKGFGGLLAGYARHAQGQGGTVLEVVGGGAERAAFEARCASLGLAERVRFHGRLSEAALAAVRGRCHAFAALPIDEPFGLVFAEAAAAGLVVLASDHGGPREIVLDGEAGLLADPFDAGSVAAAFDRLAALDAASIQRLRERAYAAARERFDRATLAPRLLAVIDALPGAG